LAGETKKSQLLEEHFTLAEREARAFCCQPHAPEAVCFSVTSEEVMFDQQTMKRQVSRRCAEEGCLWQGPWGVQGDTELAGWEWGCKLVQSFLNTAQLLLHHLETWAGRNPVAAGVLGTLGEWWSLPDCKNTR